MKRVVGVAHALPPHVAAALRESDRRIVITGAGGWLGMATLDLLRNALGDAEPGRVRCFGATERSLQLRDGTRFEQLPLDRIADLEPAPSLLLHLAFLTKDRVEAMAEDDYIAANRALSGRVLDAAAAIGAEALFVASSGAAAIAGESGVGPAMALYGALKRADEDAFAGWGTRTGGRVVTARLFNLAGPYINKHDAYALAAFIRDALAGAPIRVRATKPVWRSYVATSELMALVLATLLDPSTGSIRFDTAGEERLEMREIAARVARLLGGEVDAAAIDTALPPDIYVGDGAAYRALLAANRIPRIAFDDQIQLTAADMAAV